MYGLLRGRCRHLRKKILLVSSSGGSRESEPIFFFFFCAKQDVFGQLLFNLMGPKRYAVNPRHNFPFSSSQKVKPNRNPAVSHLPSIVVIQKAVFLIKSSLAQYIIAVPHIPFVDVMDYSIGYRSSHDSGSNNNNARYLQLAAGTTAVAGLSMAYYYFIGPLVSEYGVMGALNYIWEGDPYPNMREQFDALKDVQVKADKQEKVLGKLEEALERSHLDSIDGSESSLVLELWKANLPKNMDLRTRLGLLSSDLDELAAKVDGCPSQGAEMLKEKKKQASQRIVKLMERVDVLIAFFKKGNTKDAQ